MNQKRTHLFEVSWEVCNKVGGIYEVVASKAQQAMRAFDGEYFLIGPDTKHTPTSPKRTSPAGMPSATP